MPSASPRTTSLGPHGRPTSRQRRQIPHREDINAPTQATSIPTSVVFNLPHTPVFPAVVARDHTPVADVPAAGVAAVEDGGVMVGAHVAFGGVDDDVFEASEFGGAFGDVGGAVERCIRGIRGHGWETGGRRG